MKALVTGATGLIGHTLVRALLQRGHHVRALLRNATRGAALSGVTECAVGDVLSGTGLDAACESCDVVFHTAALFAYGGNAPELHALAVGGTENVLRAAARARVKRAVVTSTSVVFGHSDSADPIGEGELIDPMGEPPYVAAKVAQHKRALELGGTLGLDVRLACPTMTLGPTTSRLGPSNGLIVAFLADPLGCTFPGGCNLVAARDVADGHVLIAERGEVGESYLLGGENLSWQEIHTRIAALAGVAPPRLTLNRTMSYLAATTEELRAAYAHEAPHSTREQAGMVGRYYWYSHAKAARFGYAPAPAQQALVETLSWLAASPHISREVRANMHLSADVHHFRATQRGAA
jgi:dihydroflavonol-4-reductase